MPMLILRRYLQIETHMRASHAYHAVRQQLIEYYIFHAEIRSIFLTRV